MGTPREDTQIPPKLSPTASKLMGISSNEENSVKSDYLSGLAASLLSNSEKLSDTTEEQEQDKEFGVKGIGVILIPEGRPPETRVVENREALCRLIRKLDEQNYEGAVIPYIGSILSLTQTLESGNRALLFPDGNYMMLHEPEEEELDFEDIEIQEDWYVGKYRYVETSIKRATYERHAKDVIPDDIPPDTEVHEDEVQEEEDTESMY